MADTPSLKVTVQFTRDGELRRWSNRYHFSGGVPADSAHWTTLADAVTTALQIPLPPSNEIVEATGYLAGSDLPVFSKAYSAAGGLVLSGAAYEGPGDSAYLMKWSTDVRSSKNHPVFLFNYMHGVVLDGAGAAGQIWTDQRSRVNDFQHAWDTGFSDGTNTLHRAGPHGAVGTTVGRGNPFFATHRDFP